MILDGESQMLQSQGWHKLGLLHRLIQERIDKALAQCSLTSVEYAVLEVLDRQDGWHMRMLQVSHATGLSPSATTRLVARLEKRELLKRIWCEEDRRGVYTELTADGEELLQKTHIKYEAALDDSFEEARKHSELAPLVDFLIAENKK